MVENANVFWCFQIIIHSMIIDKGQDDDQWSKIDRWNMEDPMLMA